ncbi:MAG: PSD1 and planctomycete cytochrome C domain-containing protein [Pirellulaceae bacterium]
MNYLLQPLLLVLAILQLPVWGQDTVQPHDVDFASDIQTVLARKCYACHGPDLQEGNIRFDDRRTLVSEADSGLAPIVVGDASQSELIRRITSEDESERMPPEGKPLSETEVATFRQWINSGAEYASHWAFQPIQRPTLPQVARPELAEQPLDRFVLARLDAAGLQPVGRAEPRQLIRRVYLDITGLPPSPEEVAVLSRDWSAERYEQLVDRLLADPALGDRWARNWLDIVRYAETNSFERDNPKPNAWKYRDYVIRGFNSDKPYDQFVREQIAGDELEEVTTDSLTATGYYRLGIWDDEPADPLQARFDEYDDLVTTTSQAFLALTLNCARCHDHKIDPLTQKDYYSMVALLRDVTSYASRGNQTENNQLDVNTEVGQRYDEIEARERELRSQTREIEQNAIAKMPAPDQRATEGPGREKLLRRQLKDYVEDSQWQEYLQLKEELDALEQERRQLPQRETLLGLAKTDAQPEPTHVLLRGSPHSPGDLVEPAFPKLLGGGTPGIIPPHDGHSTGRRKALADWLASDQNWMTARVIANRVWLGYFGRGIVRSPNNFGLMGEIPTHPELLDHLATLLIDNEWSLKSLHRAILLSSTYQLSTAADAQGLAQDPSNNLFWRQNLRRLSAEQVRDSVLTVTGQLNEQQFGDVMYPTLSAEVLASQSRPGNGWGNSSPADQARRSIYIHVKRSLPVPLLTAFDFPETDISCEARFLTTQPGQSLTMLNSDWMQQQAAALLARVQREAGDALPAQAARVLELTTSQVADAQDIDELVDLVERLRKRDDMDETAARRAMCLVALNLNQFFYIE